MQFPYSQLHDLTDAQRNFEFLQGSNIFWGIGAPTFTPPGEQVAYYLRFDTPSTANQRIYVFTGTAWTGIV